MSKNKLSKGQQRRVQANHQRRLTKTDNKPELDDSLFGEPQEGSLSADSANMPTLKPPMALSIAATSVELSVHWSLATALCGVLVLNLA